MSAVFSRRPWGRNECVTNEPQRTSAGRLRFDKWLEILAVEGLINTEKKSDLNFSESS